MQHVEKEEANMQDVKEEEANKHGKEDEANKQGKKDKANKEDVRKGVLEWLENMHDWACRNFDARDRARAIDDYAKKTYKLTVTTTIRVCHKELSGTVYSMESTCHGIAYTTSWFGTLTTIHP